MVEIVDDHGGGRMAVLRAFVGTVTGGGGTAVHTATDPTVIDPDPAHHEPGHDKPGHHEAEGKKR
ncbi:hypothetical protein ACFYZJ_20510 [Streptomyces sp. NPDC001848]|uniref:hypothetical protein n=1 Tax=Streptomyces sp. NPDC001848 TaxID=3364618 RepID=UPI00369B75F9